MINKYGGEIDNKTLQKYFKRLIGKIYKILPMKEDGCETVDNYLTYLLQQLCGTKNVLMSDGLFIELIGTLEVIRMLKNKEDYKPQIFNCIAIIKDIIQKLEDEEDEQ